MKLPSEICKSPPMVRKSSNKLKVEIQNEVKSSSSSIDDEDLSNTSKKEEEKIQYHSGNYFNLRYKNMIKK